MADERDERLAWLLQSVPDALVVVGPEGRIERSNEAMERLFGYAAGELVGRPIEVLVPERLRSEHVRARADFAASPRDRPMGSGPEITARRKDGSEFQVYVQLRPRPAPGGPVTIAAVRERRSAIPQPDAAARACDALLAGVETLVEQAAELLPVDAAAQDPLAELRAAAKRARRLLGAPGGR